MKNPMSRFGTLQLTTLLCIIPFGRAFAAERHVPAQYPTIQAAVNAAVSGDTVRIAAGNYTEQVVVQFKTGLTLAGEPGTVLRAFPGMTTTLAAYDWYHYPVCGVYRSDVVVRDLHFEGENLGGTFPMQLDGLLFFGAGGVVTNCTFSGFRPVNPGSGVAKGLYCFNHVSTGAGQVSVTITGNTFTNNQTAIRLTGDPYSANPGQLRMTARVHGNTMTGYGPSPGYNVGLLIECGVTGDITQNFFNAFIRTGGGTAPGISAFDTLTTMHGRRVPLQPLNFEGNTFMNNGHHMIITEANNSRIVNNNILGAIPGVLSWGGLQLSGTNVLVANNNFSDMPIGTLLFDGTEPGQTIPIAPAANASLIGNWFCNVATPLDVNPLVTVLQEQGTETNCPFAPRFQSITSTNGEILTSLRGWHGDSYVIETSTNLPDWTPVHTNSMTLPLFEFRDTNAPASPHRFYRAFKQE